MLRAIPERVPSLGPGEDSARAGCEGGRAKRLQRIRLCSATRMLVATDRFGGSSSDSDWDSFPAGYPACRGAGGGGCCAFRAQGWIRVRAGRRRWGGGCGAAGRWDRLGQGDGRTVAALVSGSRGSSRAATAAHGSELNQRLPESLIRPARDGGPPAGLLGLVIPSREFERPHVRNVGNGTNTTSRRNRVHPATLSGLPPLYDDLSARVEHPLDHGRRPPLLPLPTSNKQFTDEWEDSPDWVVLPVQCRRGAQCQSGIVGQNLLTNDFLHFPIPNRL